MSIKNFKFIFVLAFICASNINYTKSASIEPENPGTENQAAVLDAILQKVIKQIDSIDLGLEALAQGIHSNVIKTENKKSFQEHIGNIRKFISKIRKEELSEPNASDLSRFLEINKSILAHLNRSIGSKLNIEELTKLSQKTSNFTKKRRYKALKPNDAETKIESLELDLKTFENKLERVGLSDFNVWAKRTEKSLKRKKLDKIATRSLPYIVAATYCLYSLPEATVESWNLSWITKFKKFIGTSPLPGRIRIPNKYKKPGIAEAAPATGPAEAAPATGPLDTMEINIASNQGGVLGSLAHLLLLSNVANIQAESLITWSPTVVLVPIMKKDATDLRKWGTEQYKKLKSKAKGEIYEDPALPRRAKKINFEDIIGIGHVQEELNKILNYFRTKTKLDLMGTQVPKGYLFVGPIDYGQKLVQSLGNEITKILSEKYKNDFCGIWQIHASELVKKDNKDAKDGKLADIVNQIKAKEKPCIIFINEFDWLCKQSNIEPEVWTDVMTTITSTVNNPKLDIFIIASAKDLDDVRSKIKDPTTFPGILKFETPNLDDRIAFFAKELGDRCINISDSDIEDLALQTENCSFNKLESVIKRALSNAHTQNRTVNKDDLEQYINQIVYNINLDEQSIDKKEKNILAAHFAGKTLAHTILNPNVKLSRVTILPVNTESKTKQGALITYEQTRKIDFTESDLEIEALLELSGIEAQKQLVPAVSHKLLSEANKKALKRAKQIVLSGIDEKSVGKKVREQKRDEAFELVQKWTEKVATIAQENKNKLSAIYSSLNSKMILNTQDLQQLTK